MSSGSPEAELKHVDGPKGLGFTTDEEKEKKERRLREIRAQIEQIKKQIEETDGQPSSTASESRRRGDDDEDYVDGPASVERNNDLSNKDSSSTRKPYEAKKRQRETIERVHRFKDKLKEVSKKDSGKPQPAEKDPSTSGDVNDGIEDESGLLDLVDDDSWLKHRFEAKDEPNSDFEDQEDERHSQRQRDRGSRRAEKDSRRHGDRDRSRSSSRTRRDHSTSDVHHRRRMHKYHDDRDRERSSRDKDRERHHRRQ